ncbi:basement membrane-specific heparan sulfate proteoglycan core protein-like isoform X2 [Hyla sarda]|uniref:basement membrane-specific heparan sulfate proteoglycan core protein-like isoform X2 n=1 Tax=Hyla sarda TaxID=327740 RepID=UPI0024C2E19F|nr:basement membrane-specific heparan sulfate proteoglycan core protein-like isoform X2 [Hyla sarda]
MWQVAQKSNQTSQYLVLRMFRRRKYGVPYLETDEKLSIYVAGDDITLLCCSSLIHQILEFFKGDSIIYSIEQDKNCTSHMVKITTQQDIGPYYCASKALENGTYVQSNMSNPFTIPFADTPLPPSIMLEPSYSVYTTKESMHLACVTPKRTAARGIQIYREEKKIHEAESLNQTYEISASDKDASGKYYCKYWVEKNGRKIYSSSSEHTTVNVTDVPLAPSLSLKPEHSVFTKEEAITLTCSFPPGFTVEEVNFYRNGELFPMNNLQETETFVMATLNASTTAKYTCQYSVKINGRKIASDSSNEVTISITEPPQVPSITLGPLQPVYTTEETVAVICSVPHNLNGDLKSVKFYRSEQQIYKQEACKRKCSYTVSNPTTQLSGEYTCEYLMSIYGRELSARSQSVQVTFIEPPPVPSITLGPLQPVYTTEETVAVICSVPHNLNGDLKSVKFYRSEQQIYKQEACNRKCSYTVSNPTTQLSGEYTCEYLMSIYGRELSARSQSVQVTFIDIPQTPSVFLTPKQPVYLKGETVNITCSLPEGPKAISIQYFKDGQEIHRPKRIKTMSTCVLSNLYLENTGSYTCQYWLSYSGRQISSHRSLPISITVEEIPQSPSIELSPMMSVYTKGESVGIKCVPPTDSEVVHIQYFKDDKIIHRSFEHLFVISSLSQENKGNYSCGYVCNRYGRQIISKPSQSVPISVLDIPQVPSIILNPKLPVYIKGENVSIICLVPEESTIISILYFKDNQEISETTKTTSSYIVPYLSLENTGQYKCQYSLNIYGRNISSHSSLSISIIVEEPLVAPVLKLVPDEKLYIVGERLFLTCVGYLHAQYNIYKDSQLLQNDFSHLIPSLQLYHNGNYTCTYSIDNKGRQMESPRSHTVNMYVIAPLPAPTLTLGGPIVKEEDGFKLTLNCSAPDDDLLTTFYYLSMTEKSDLINLTDFSATFELKVGFISHISYTCEYDRELRGRMIRSRRSPTLFIQLSEASMMTPPVIAGIIGAVSLLLCFSLALWFYMKSKKHNRHNRFRFSWYWKENQSPKKSYSPRPLSPEQKLVETNHVLDLSGEGHYKTVSRNPSSLSIATQKEADAPEGAINFSTFHSKNVSDGDCVWNSSTL